jgi:hypothetical protein
MRKYAVPVKQAFVELFDLEPSGSESSMEPFRSKGLSGGAGDAAAAIDLAATHPPATAHAVCVEQLPFGGALRGQDNYG